MKPRLSWLLSVVAVALACGNSKNATKGNAEAATSTAPAASSVAQIEVDAAVEAAAPVAPPEVLAGADFAADAKKLFRVRPGGTVKRGQAFKRHILTKKSPKRIRQLRGCTQVAAVDVPSVQRMLPNS